MPLIHKEVRRFVQYWNMHKIRSQKNWPNITTGRPNDLYHNSTIEVPNYDRSLPNRALNFFDNLTSTYSIFNLLLLTLIRTLNTPSPPCLWTRNSQSSASLKDISSTWADDYPNRWGCISCRTDTPILRSGACNFGLYRTNSARTLYSES